MQQWLLLGRGLWWLAACIQTGLLILPDLAVYLPIQLRLMLWWLLLIGLSCLLVELLYSLLHKIQQRHIAARSQSSYLRIRLPRPQESRRPMPHSDNELWHGLHGLFANQHSKKREQPWLSLTLSAAADERVNFGALVGSQSGQARQECLSSLRRILSGYAPDALIDAAPDPLLSACQNAPIESVVACVELLPAWGPEYLLRSLQEAESDMLTPLLAQMRPHSDVLYCEIQLSIRPKRELLNSTIGWRSRAAQRLVRTHQLIPASHMTNDSMGIQEKLSAPLFESIIRLCIVATSPSIATSALQEAQLAFAQYTRRSGQRTQHLRAVRSSIRTLPMPLRPEDALLAPGSRLLPIPARHPPPQSIARILLPIALCQSPALLCNTELAGLWHLPGAEHSSLVSWLSCRFLAAAAQAHIHTTSATAEPGPRIMLGHALRADGSLVPVGPYLRDLRQILHVTAGMGGGKSRLLANLAQQLMPTGFVLIDGKGDDAGNLAATVRTLIHQEDEWRLVILDMTDSEWPVGINPLLSVERGRQGALDQLSAMLDSVFARIDIETWQQAPGMQQFLSNATRLVLEGEPKPTLLHVQRALVDEAYRRQLLEQASDLELITFWRDIFPKMGEGQRSSMTALLRRFERLLGSELVRSFISQQQATFRFAEAFEQGLIVICPIPHVRYGTLASTVAMLIFMALMRAAFERPGTAATRSDYALIVDEFQVLVEHGATQDVATALTQLRSLGIPSIYAHQTLSQIGDLRDLLMVNAENRVIIRTQEPDASSYARHYAASGISATDISGQDASEHQYARFAIAGSPMPLCSIKPLPWPTPPGDGHLYLEKGLTQNSKLKAQNLPEAWRSIVPAGDEAQQRYDQQLALLCHREYSAKLAQALAQCSTEDWALIMQRWPVIARAQRRYILTHPACIPNRLERQRWLSRLGFARPRLLVDAEYRRLRGV